MGSKWNGLARNKPPRKISLKRLAKLKALNKTVGNGLNRGKAPRMVSLKKQREIKSETAIKKAIREKANGHCSICGLEATAPFYAIEVHEIVFRSAGGKISFDNSVAICSLCHHLIQRYIFRFKGQALRIIIQWRKIGYSEATQIYNKIIKFCEEHNIQTESKYVQKDKTITD